MILIEFKSNLIDSCSNGMISIRDRHFFENKMRETCTILNK